MRFADHERVAAVLFYIALAVLASLIFLVLRPFLVPLGWAAVLVTIFHSVHERFEQRWGPTGAAAVSTTAVALIVVAPLLMVMIAFVREALQAAGDVQRAFAEGRLAWVERAWAWLEQRSMGARRVDVAAAAVDWARQLAAVLAAQVGTVLQNIAVFVFHLVVTLFATFFLFRDRDLIMHTIRRALPLDKRVRERLIRQTHDLVSASVVSAGIVAGAQGLLGGLLFAALGIDAPVFWGVVTTFFCLLPFGAWVVWLPAAILFIAAGDWKRGLIVAGFGFAVVSAADNVLRPALLSGRARMNGLLVFISLLGGIRVFGSLGLILGPTLLATGITVLKIYTSTDTGETPSAT